MSLKGRITATWDYPTTPDGDLDPNIKGFLIQTKRPKESWYTHPAQEANRFDLFGLIPEQSYLLRVASINRFGDTSAWSAPVEITAQAPTQATIASADPLDLGTTLTNRYLVTGTTDFSDISTERVEGSVISLEFDNELTITHGSGINFPDEKNLKTKNGTVLTLTRSGSNWVAQSINSAALDSTPITASDILYRQNHSQTVAVATTIDLAADPAESTNSQTLNIQATPLGTNDGTNYWDIQVLGDTYDTTENTSLNSSRTNYVFDINELTLDFVQIVLTPVGTPGSLRIAALLSYKVS